MKVLYIAHFYEGTGWSKAAINYVLAMDAAGIDVAIRSVNLTDAPQANLPFKLLKMLKKIMLLSIINMLLWDTHQQKLVIMLYILHK